MKLFYGIVLVLMVFVSACAQQAAPEAAPEAAPSAPAPAAAPSPADDTEVEAPEVVETTSEDIRALNGGNFEPNELAISVGSSVTWRNTVDTNMVIIVFKENRAFSTSQKLDMDETFEQEFTEPGEYQFWQNLAFSGDSGTITVS